MHVPKLHFLNLNVERVNVEHHGVVPVPTISTACAMHIGTEGSLSGETPKEVLHVASYNRLGIIAFHLKG